MKFIVYFSLLLSFAPGEVSASDMKCWRSMSRAELIGEWRNPSLARFSKVSGDFNGDKNLDSAELVVSTDGSSMAVRVQFGPKESIQTLLIDVQENSASIMGIELANPGKYLASCLDQRCFESRKQVSVPLDSIRVFRDAGSAKIAFLDRRDGKFRFAWVSD